MLVLLGEGAGVVGVDLLVREGGLVGRGVVGFVGVGPVEEGGARGRVCFGFFVGVWLGEADGFGLGGFGCCSLCGGKVGGEGGVIGDDCLG